MATEDMNPLEMSDEDFLNAPAPAGDVATEQQAEVKDEAVSEGAVDDDAGAKADEPTTNADPDSDTNPDPEASAEVDEPGAGTAPGKSAEGEEAKPGTEAKNPEVKGKVDEKAGKEEAKPATETPGIDYKAEYEKLLAPFKANGKDFTIKSVDDAKSLMQMGANYSKKMAQLKPNLKLLKLLEQADLLSPEKISFVIDVMANKPGAVNKLVKEAGIDPMDLDAEKAGEYQQATYEVSDATMDLDEVMKDLRQSPKVDELITLVTEQLDHASTKAIKEDPAILRDLDAHMNSGVYDVIMAEVEQERVLGRLKNKSFLDAYKQIGDSIQARGGFNHLFQGSSQKQTEETKPARIVEPPKSSKADEDKLKEKRRAASSNRPVVATASKTADKDFNPLNMSDADFLKMGL